MPDRPLVVVEGTVAAVRQLVANASASATDRGWTIVRGWAAPMARERVVCRGVVADEDSARRALLAAVAGSGLIVRATAKRDVVERFLDDLMRLGTVDHVVLPDHPRGLADRERAMLGLIGEGMSVVDAARALGITRRTAERRLASARRRLGVNSNAEAVVAAIAAHR
jgi:DNA-binding CsgD family transcriptional regulator